MISYYSKRAGIIGIVAGALVLAAGIVTAVTAAVRSRKGITY